MSDPIPVFQAKLDDRGVLQLTDRPAFRGYVRSLGAGTLDVIVRKHRDQRSLPQNRYYHSVVVAILAEHFGYSHDEAHDAIAWEFLILPPEPGKPRRRRSTAGLNTTEFEEYLERVKRWAAEKYAVYIPDPNEAESA